MSSLCDRVMRGREGVLLRDEEWKENFCVGFGLGFLECVFSIY